MSFSQEEQALFASFFWKETRLALTDWKTVVE
jgi:hypothetical protein